MSVLIDSSGPIPDDWIRLSDEDSIDGLGRMIVSSARLQQDWSLLENLDTDLAVALEVTDSVEAVALCLPRLDLVILNFEIFADGRAFSQARLLRERFSYRGDIRAQGDVLRDQLSFMRRCGINQFHLAADEDVDLALGAFGDISLSYQPELAQSLAS